MRQDDQVWAGAHRSLAVATLKGVDLALQALFRRVKAGVNGGGKVGHVGGSIVDSPSPTRLPGVVAGLEYAALARSTTWRHTTWCGPSQFLTR